MWAHPLNLALRFVRWHQGRLRAAPLVTNCLTSASIMVLGDRVAQRIERGGKPIETREQWAQSLTRTGILSFWSLSASAPFWLWYYHALARLLPGRQLVWIVCTIGVSAPFNAAFFAYGATADHLVGHPQPLSGEGRREWAASVRERLETRLWPTWVNNTRFWPLVNLFLFTVVPLESRQLFSSVAGVAWNVFLSRMHAGTITTEAPAVALLADAEAGAAQERTAHNGASATGDAAQPTKASEWAEHS